MDNNKINLSAETLLIRHPSLFASEVDQDLIMLDEKAGLYFALNPVAADVWKLLEKPISYEALLQSLLQLYDVQYQQCKADVDSLLAKLMQYQLVSIVTQS